jgi:hypothetical protein
MKGFIKKFYQRFNRIILRYDNEFIPVVKNITAGFNLTNNIKS